MSPAFSATVLKLASWGLLAFALLFATGSYAPIDGPASFLLDLLDWPIDSNHADISRDLRWMVAVVGGLLVMLAIILLKIIIPQVEQGNTALARTMFMAVLAWAIIDCAGSWAAGVFSNSVFNLGFAAPFLLAFGLMKPEKAI